MLRRLTVKNLAIVEDLELELGEGLTVVTGETGAGKSILVDALALLAGGRGSADLVREGAERLVVAGEFEVDRAARRILEEAGLPAASATVLVRRELSADGRGRAYVEDEPASVRTLARLGERLVAILGQNAELELLARDTSLELLDAFARAEAEREEVGRAAEAWKSAREALESLRASGRERAARLDFLGYQIRELEAVAEDASNEEALRADRERLKHADRVRQAGEAALAALSEADGSAADRLGEAARAFAELAAIDPREEEHRAEAEELKARVAELAAAARDAAGSIEADPELLTSLETRLERVARAVRKHGVAAADVPALLEKLRAENEELSNLDDALGRREKDESTARDGYRRAAAALSAKRRSAAVRFASAVEKELAGLALEKARFRVALDAAPEEEPRSTGAETAAFLFAPNPGEAEKRLERVASGGELSRVQLALRAVVAGRKARGRTFVFDEVDAGVGGRTAEFVGKKLREIAREDQVLCVTHVPQIAALADRHFAATKSERRGRTVASVRLLDGRERVEELARMLAGEKVPETALRHARALLAEAAK